MIRVEGIFSGLRVKIEVANKCSVLPTRARAALVIVAFVITLIPVREVARGQSINIRDYHLKIYAPVSAPLRGRREPSIRDQDSNVGLHVVQEADELVHLLDVDFARVVLTVDRGRDVPVGHIGKAATDQNVDLTVDFAELAKYFLIELDARLRSRPGGELLVDVVLVVSPSEIRGLHPVIVDSGKCRSALPSV